jgi:hypothetical protein
MASANEAGIIRFADAAMQIRVPLGRWVDIGMVAGGQNEALSAIVDSGKKEREAAYSIWMMIATVP